MSHHHSGIDGYRVNRFDNFQLKHDASIFRFTFNINGAVFNEAIV